jgi:hypothetical protein
LFSGPQSLLVPTTTTEQAIAGVRSPAISTPAHLACLDFSFAQPPKSCWEDP